MRSTGLFLTVLALVALLAARCNGPDRANGSIASPDTIRAVTFNIEDVRTEALKDPEHPRLRRAAAIIQHLRPDVLLVNEMTYDQPGGPGVDSSATPGQNARRFAENFLAAAQADSLRPLQYEPFMAPVNTGIASGFDLDNDGDTVTAAPELPPTPDDGSPPPQTEAGRAYGNDAYGFGTFPGQYGMALFVREGLEILEDAVHTFRLLKWADLPEARLPEDPETGAPWYSAEEREAFRLSSKSHWDVPVRLPSGDTLHVLASHPTPPAFDGPEERNVHRNHAEIRFWADYLSGASYVRDDSGRVGGLPEGAPLLVMGDLNSDPDEGNSQAVGLLLEHPRVDSSITPTAGARGARAFPDLDPDDTAQWGQRVDYVLPSKGLDVLEGGIWRPTGADTAGAPVSDHFPVWLDVVVW